MGDPSFRLQHLKNAWRCDCCAGLLLDKTPKGIQVDS